MIDDTVTMKDKTYEIFKFLNKKTTFTRTKRKNEYLATQ